MLSVIKQISFFAAISGIFLAASQQSEITQTQISPSEFQRETVLREVFGTKTIEGLNSHFANRFERARERAMVLAQQVEDHELSLMEARDSLFDILIQMDRGQGLAILRNPATVASSVKTTPVPKFQKSELKVLKIATESK